MLYFDEIFFVLPSGINSNENVHAEDTDDCSKDGTVLIEIFELAENAAKVDCVRWNIEITAECCQMVTVAHGCVICGFATNEATIGEPLVGLCTPVLATLRIITITNNKRYLKTLTKLKITC